MDSVQTAQVSGFPEWQKSAQETNLDSLRYLVHILRLDDRLQVIFQNFGEVVLELRSTKMLQDLSPVWWVLEEVGDGMLQAMEERLVAIYKKSNEFLPQNSLLSTQQFQNVNSSEMGYNHQQEQGEEKTQG